MLDDIKTGILVLIVYTSFAAMIYIGYNAIDDLINLPYWDGA